MFGFLNINKPSGITSHGIISKLRKITGIKQIGHAGTLDPLASGVLPVAVGKASRLIDFMEEDKRYTAGLLLGKASNTYDTDGVVKDTGYRKITSEEISEILPLFTGNIKQIPPAFSAVHYNGKRLYEMARKGHIPDDIPSREVIIYNLKVLDFDYEHQALKLDVSCSKGTYIRSLVNDIGETLKSGAVMFELIRTKSSGLTLENSFTLTDGCRKEDISKRIINPLDVLKLPVVNANEEEYKKILNGNKFKKKGCPNGNILIVKDNKIIAFGTVENDIIQPKRVLL